MQNNVLNQEFVPNVLEVNADPPSAKQNFLLVKIPPNTPDL
ncbi:hypothetical protein LEP1GSC017_0059 [Leptospira meyeri serovar Hardjo str. Went 5]|nr:hypothetical protein LEP1GSC017_0059 [Leptospira meyeri serovar Hardjo str. Went 5]EMJ87220.1 hypothetical protein LEP1GSC196_0151 [Leptospira meyeri serovar Semaranga str. Veldrot Semarang 173]